MPNYAREHAPLWSPSAPSANLNARKEAVATFKQHRKVTAYTLGAGGVFLATPNASGIVQPPAAMPSGLPQVFADGRWGPLEWTRTPQLLSEATEHRAYAHRLDLPGLVDPAFVTPRDGHEFRTFNYSTRCGHLRPDFLEALLALRDSEERAALQAAHGNVNYHSVLSRDDASEAALVRLNIDNRTLEDTRIDVAIAQRRIVELRAFTAWTAIRRAWKYGWVREPIPLLPVVGAWLDFGHKSAKNSCGSPFWASRAGTPRPPTSGKTLLRA